MPILRGNQRKLKKKKKKRNRGIDLPLQFIQLRSEHRQPYKTSCELNKRGPKRAFSFITHLDSQLFS